PGYGWPWYLVRAGLGSKRSIWLGPPCWNRQMTDLARGFAAKRAFVIAGRGEPKPVPVPPRASPARDSSWSSRHDRPSVPIAPAYRPRNARRLNANGDGSIGREGIIIMVVHST